MRLRPSLLIALLTLCFALLQGMAPLLHAHLNGDNSLDDGPHMHMAELTLAQEEASDSDHAFHWHIHANKTPGMILGLTPALTAQGWQLPDSQPLWLIWIQLPALLMTAMVLTAPRISFWRGWQAPRLGRRHPLHLLPSVPRAPPRF